MHTVWAILYSENVVTHTKTLNIKNTKVSGTFEFSNLSVHWLLPSFHTFILERQQLLLCNGSFKLARIILAFIDEVLVQFPAFLGIHSKGSREQLEKLPFLCLSWQGLLYQYHCLSSGKGFVISRCAPSLSSDHVCRVRLVTVATQQSAVTSSLVVRPAISCTIPMKAARLDLVSIHRNRALLVVEIRCVCLEAASTFTVCSSVRSTGHLLNWWGPPNWEYTFLKNLSKARMRIVDVQQVQLELCQPAWVIHMIGSKE